MSKQIRISDTAFDEIKKLAEEYDVDRGIFISASLVLIKAIIENKASSIKFINDKGIATSMPVPLVYKKNES